MFTVYDTGVPADCYYCHVGISWDKSSYDTFTEALEYAANWLGPYVENSQELFEALDSDNRFYYGGHGDYIEIREE